MSCQSIYHTSIQLWCQRSHPSYILSWYLKNKAKYEDCVSIFDATMARMHWVRRRLSNSQIMHIGYGGESHVKLTLSHVMACCQQPTSQMLKLCWPSSWCMRHHWSQWVNLWQNSRYIFVLRVKGPGSSSCEFAKSLKPTWYIMEGPSVWIHCKFATYVRSIGPSGKLSQWPHWIFRVQGSKP